MLVTRGRAPIVDPPGGLADLAARRLRPAGPGVLDDDPLRALRAVRLEATLGLRLTAPAARAVRRAAPGLERVSPERVRDGLLIRLPLPDTARALRRADALGLLAVVVPEIEAMRVTAQPAPHRFDVLEHSLRAVAGCDRLLARLDALAPYGEELAAHVAEPLGGGARRAAALKLAALLHDVSKPETRQRIAGRVRFFEHDVIGARRVRALGERLRLPERVIAVVERLVRHHLRPMHLGHAAAITPRARYRFYRDLREDTRDLLLLVLADGAAVTGASPLATWRRAGVVRELLAGWSEQREAETRPALLRGGGGAGGQGRDRAGRRSDHARHHEPAGGAGVDHRRAHFRDALGARSEPQDHSRSGHRDAEAGGADHVGGQAPQGRQVHQRRGLQRRVGEVQYRACDGSEDARVIE